MCFQCGEKDCEHFENELPKWVKDFFVDFDYVPKLNKLILHENIKGENDDELS